MLKIPIYLLPNRIKVVASLSESRTEFRQVYQRKIKLYKGIDNNLEFQVKNNDQKPVDISVYTATLVLLDQDQNLILQKDGTGDSTLGTLNFVVTASELEQIDQQYLLNTVYLTHNSTNESILVYTDTQYNASGTVEIIDSSFPRPRAAQVVSVFNSDLNNVFTSEAVELQNSIGGNDATTTIAFYADLDDNVEIWATIDPSSNDSSTVWSKISEINLLGSTLTYTNITGNYTFIRFKYNGDYGTIEKVLVRN